MSYLRKIFELINLHHDILKVGVKYSDIPNFNFTEITIDKLERNSGEIVELYVNNSGLKAGA